MSIDLGFHMGGSLVWKLTLMGTYNEAGCKIFIVFLVLLISTVTLQNSSLSAFIEEETETQKDTFIYYLLPDQLV